VTFDVSLFGLHNRYASQWFMTIFTVGFPFECTVRIYDAFLTEGPKILFRVALYIMKENEVSILNGGLEEFFKSRDLFISNLTWQSIDKMMDKAVAIDIKR